ncbi:GNAT family N-acetyltransferase [Sphingomonas sp. HDW15A]|uniref:GNAT family N-acetyltransferase n=1 Tax=Sphingomonas sp. HDW15A TaxID=2714942 RepID=UPI00140A9774|nr:GNAT family N-acetyltransferase [Sphingomonas sp. HDW15A]QIK96054.1 GNAT family N-acetyltransferase [Sphingomonas sp. HDW15A]
MAEKLRSAPTLETGRLLLRAWRKDDFRPWQAIMHQPDVHRHFGPTPIGEEELWRRMAAGVGSWPLLGIGSWAVERKADGRLIGNVGLFNAWRALEPVFGEEPEMGWIFSTEVHGQGMAGEACRAALDWFDAHVEPVPVWAIIAPENTPSLKLAERLGFIHHNETIYNGEPTFVLKRTL